MNKLLEVKEFDIIVEEKSDVNAENPDPSHKYKYLDSATFEDLINFIQEFDASDKEAHILDFIKTGRKKRRDGSVARTVTFNNYVGLIQMQKGLQIQILPKVRLTNKLDNESDADKDKRIKNVFIKMLRCLDEFPNKKFSDANLGTDRMNLYEIFINMYLQEVRELVKRGIRSTYVVQEDNLTVFKGKLLVNEHLKRNIAHKERFYVSFDEYQVNRPENKLVKSTLLKLQRLTKSSENARAICQLLTAFELVDPSDNCDKDFSKVVIDRSMKDYEMLMRWSKVFLKNKSFTTFSGTESAKALLFPMEKVFEAYVAKNMRSVFGSKGWTVSAQDKGFHLFNKLNGKNKPKFALRPDLVARKGKELTVVLDTKWKILNDKQNENYGISQLDMYQMYAYGKKYKTPHVWLLYPLSEERSEDTLIFDSGDEDGLTVSLFFVDLEDIKSSMEKLFLEVTKSVTKSDLK